MLRHITPQHALGISEEQTTRFPCNLPHDSKLKRSHSQGQQAVSVKLTEDCLNNLLDAADKNLPVIVQVNSQGLSFHVETGSSAIKFDCFIQRVTGDSLHIVCNDEENCYDDLALVSTRAQVKPTQHTLESSKQKAQEVSKTLEIENSKFRTQILQGSTTSARKPENRHEFRRTTEKSFSKKTEQEKKEKNTTMIKSVISVTPINTPVRRNTNLELREHVINCIASGNFLTHEDAIFNILRSNLPSGFTSEIARKKVCEVVHEVADVSTASSRLTLLPCSLPSVKTNWLHSTTQEKLRVLPLCSDSTEESLADFAPIRSNNRTAMRTSHRTNQQATPTMSHSTTTSPDETDTSAFSSPSPGERPTQRVESNIFTPSKRKIDLLFKDDGPPNKKCYNAAENDHSSTSTKRSTETDIKKSSQPSRHVSTASNEKTIASVGEKDYKNQSGHKHTKARDTVRETVKVTDEKPQTGQRLKESSTITKTSNCSSFSLHDTSKSQTSKTSSPASSHKAKISANDISKNDSKTSASNTSRRKKSSSKSDETAHSDQKKVKEEQRKSKKIKNEATAEKNLMPIVPANTAILSSIEKISLRSKKSENRLSMMAITDDKSACCNDVPRIKIETQLVQQNSPKDESPKSNTCESPPAKNADSGINIRSGSSTTSSDINLGVSSQRAAAFYESPEFINGDGMDAKALHLLDISVLSVQKAINLIKMDVKPNKNYLERYKSVSDAKVADDFFQEEIRLYKHYDDISKKLDRIYNDIELYVNRLNAADSEAEQIHVEGRIRTYVGRCLADTHYIQLRQEIGNLVAAIKTIRYRLTDYYKNKSSNVI